MLASWFSLVQLVEIFDRKSQLVFQLLFAYSQVLDEHNA